MLLDSLQSAHVGAKGFGDEHGAIGLLVIFKDGEPCAANGQAGTVDGVDEFWFGLGATGIAFCVEARRAEADVGAAGLEALEV